MSLQGDISPSELLDAIEGVRKGKPVAINKLIEYVEEGAISTKLYNKVIEEYGTSNKTNNRSKGIWSFLRKRPRKKTVYIICIILSLLLAYGAIVYYCNATEDAYSEGKRIGYSEGYKAGYDKGYAYYEEIRDEYKFFHEYAVRVTTTGKNYHRYDCYHVEDKTFYIYNISNAKAKGYTPCLDCFD